MSVTLPWRRWWSCERTCAWCRFRIPRAPWTPIASLDRRRRLDRQLRGGDLVARRERPILLQFELEHARRRHGEIDDAEPDGGDQQHRIHRGSGAFEALQV